MNSDDCFEEIGGLVAHFTFTLNLNKELSKRKLKSPTCRARLSPLLRGCSGPILFSTHSSGRTRFQCLFWPCYNSTEFFSDFFFLAESVSVRLRPRLQSSAIFYFLSLSENACAVNAAEYRLTKVIWIWAGYVLLFCLPDKNSTMSNNTLKSYLFSSPLLLHNLKIVFKRDF